MKAGMKTAKSFLGLAYSKKRDSNFERSNLYLAKLENITTERDAKPFFELISTELSTKSTSSIIIENTLYVKARDLVFPHYNFPV